MSGAKYYKREWANDRWKYFYSQASHDKYVERGKNESNNKQNNLSEKIKNIPANQIKTIEQYTDKKHFNEKVISGIKQSILAKGYDVSEPLKVDKDESGEYRVVDGHHRFEAVKQLIQEGHLSENTPIPVVEEKYDSEADRLLAQVSSNKNRREVERLDDAKAYSQLIDQGKTVQEISERTGESQEYVKGTIALNNLIPELKELLRSDAKYNIRKKDETNDGSKEKRDSLSESLAIVIAKNGLNEDGSPNGTIQRKAFQWYNQNKSKGITPSQVRLYISTLKSQTFSFGNVDSSGRSEIEREAMKFSGGEDVAKATTAGFENLLKKIQNPIQKFLGDTITNLDEKKTKELAASIIATKGESALETELEKLSAVLNSISLFRDSLKRKFQEIQADSMTPELLFKSRHAIVIIREFLKARYGEEKPGHKYLYRKWINGKWERFYKRFSFKQFIKDALSSKTGFGRFIFKGISQKESKILFRIGIPYDKIELFRHSIDHDTIRKIVNDHGRAKTEIPRGNVPVTLDDIKKIPEIIAHPDTITLDESDKKTGLPALIYTKKINNQYIIVEKVLTGKNLLSVKTMYKTRGRIR
ncbi:MAG: ParB N-terminal domain-containing protein [Leptospiraceae bacterium]|nr:ParB N-terminal domain-containing protein [Leptospiraceae bacterium]NUM41555.1 ParB N-terminal domain-containing protein [Leptospiraceae bacterium]